MKHTPGPWQAEEQDGDEWYFGDGQVVILTGDGHDSIAVLPVRHKANARLIAAAPELLEALRNALLALDMKAPAECHEQRSMARAAIAKAEGKQ